jgi:hypothetical protein
MFKMKLCEAFFICAVKKFVLQKYADTLLVLYKAY